MSLNKVKLKFLDELNDFLPDRFKGVTVFHEFKGNPSIKHIIESVGIPHTEVGNIIVNDCEVDFTYLTENEDEVLVKPLTIGIENDIFSKNYYDEKDNPRFVLDNHLGKLAIYLRMLGLDTLYENYFQDDLLAEIACSRYRILLTRDRELLKRKNIKYGCWIRSLDPNQQLQEIFKKYKLNENLSPFNRCLKCNTKFQKIEKDLIVGRLEPLTQKYYHEFYYCDHCDQVFWKGSHYQRMNEFITSFIFKGENTNNG